MCQKAHLIRDLVPNFCTLSRALDVVTGLVSVNTVLDLLQVIRDIDPILLIVAVLCSWMSSISDCTSASSDCLSFITSLAVEVVQRIFDTVP